MGMKNHSARTLLPASYPSPLLPLLHRCSLSCLPVSSIPLPSGQLDLPHSEISVTSNSFQVAPSDESSDGKGSLNFKKGRNGG